MLRINVHFKCCHWRGSYQTMWCYGSTTQLYLGRKVKVKKQSCSCKRPWRPIALLCVEAPTFLRQSVHRWRWDCQPYATTALYPSERSSATRFCYRLSKDQCHNAPGKIRPIEKSNNHQGNTTRDFPACSIVIQPSALLRAYKIPVSATLFGKLVQLSLNY
jgi:hypothetical protein